MMENCSKLNPQDNFQIFSSYYNISDIERESLDMLYQPIIGINAYALINCFWRMYEHDTDFSMHANFELLAYLNIDIKAFYEARLKLEGSGLIKTYIKDNKYVYRLVNPLNPTEFFKDDLLSVTLLQIVGENRYTDLSNSLVNDTLSLDGFDDISKNFLQVFNIKGSELSKTPDVINQTKEMINDYEDKGSNKPNIDDDFDFSLILSILESSFVNLNDVKKNHELINSEHLLYGIDETNMARLIERSTNVNNNVFDPKKLKILADRQFNNQNSVQEDNRKTYIPEDTQKLDNSEKQIVEMAQEYSPIDFLQGLKVQVDGFVHDNEVRTIRDVIEVSVLKPEVINMITYHIIIDQKKSGLSRNLFTTIADNWSQKGVRTAEDAITEIRNRKKSNDEKKRERKRNYRKPIKEELPDWAKKSNSTKKNVSIDNNLSNSRRKELDDKLKKIRSWRKEGR
ncbi:DnaD domain protein [Apilactobacillus apisilvae]|uniref:DnaD domain protein n=1 Tax=Apilactobacillus apisilvae TaxID=2923364 RepID=A0ABY4PI26_9LACO|nr:DnaD domain protein [Apilactobacillus apisilvae]UQS85267.1 DnaD domain protein [Apilactobacillus apisilvae]